MSKTVLITGTSSGFGKLAAELLASKGHKVYATMRNINGKNAAIAKELATRPNITVLNLEMADTNSNNDAVAQVIRAEGKLDVLINNAGSFFLGIGGHPASCAVPRKGAD
jgi:NAD(P)-dependent dehydrogenase (short-subunit alcohol dehydrogenase family)